MTSPPEPSPADASENSSDVQQAVERLHRLTIYGRWLLVGSLWLTIGSWSLWSLRRTIALALENFTWAALRYGLVFDRGAAIGLTLCIAPTVAVLVWQVRNSLWGLPRRDRQRLERQVDRVQKQGRRHPLWKWLFQSDSPEAIRSQKR